MTKRASKYKMQLTSGDSATWGGYTAGQIVVALRNTGLLS